MAHYGSCYILFIYLIIKKISLKHTENSNTVQKKPTKQQKQYTKLKQYQPKKPTPKQDGQQLSYMTVNLHWKPHLPHLQQISLFSSVQGYAFLNSILALTCLLLAVTNVNQTLIIIFDNKCNLFKPSWSSMHQCNSNPYHYLQCIRGGKWPINQLALKAIQPKKKKKKKKT